MTCGKKRYRTRKEAKKALKDINHTNALDKKLTDVYYCNDCIGFHITSMKKKKSRQYRKIKSNL